MARVGINSAFLWFALATSSITGCCGLQIINLDVPDVIQNGSRSSVILDCVYRYEHHEKDGLVVKWFWNHDPEAVYQWIPGDKPMTMGILKGRVNLDYLASKDEYSQHRAMEILYPTTELTGYFTCRVSSFYDEQLESKKMIVYAPVTSMNISYHKPSPTTVNITCEAHGIYPQPRLMLYEGATPETSTQVDWAKDEVHEGDDGFSVFLHVVLEDRILKERETIFECVLIIPQTEYTVRRQMIYFPGYETFNGFGGAGREVLSGQTLLLVMLLLLTASLYYVH